MEGRDGFMHLFRKGASPIGLRKKKEELFKGLGQLVDQEEQRSQEEHNEKQGPKDRVSKARDIFEQQKHREKFKLSLIFSKGKGEKLSLFTPVGHLSNGW